MYKWTNRQSNEQPNRHTDRLTDKQTHNNTVKQIIIGLLWMFHNYYIGYNLNNILISKPIINNQWPVKKLYKTIQQ